MTHAAASRIASDDSPITAEQLAAFEAVEQGGSEHHQLMHRAFVLADPTRPAHNGYPARDWKDPIDFRGTTTTMASVCKHLGVTLEDVVASIEYMTATKATVVRRPIANCPGEELIIVTAPGYRAGPAA